MCLNSSTSVANKVSFIGKNCGLSVLELLLCPGSLQANSMGLVTGVDSLSGRSRAGQVGGILSLRKQDKASLDLTKKEK